LVRISPVSAVAGIVVVVTTMAQPEEPHLLVLPPEQALAAARPLPDREHMVIEDVSDEEWDIFFSALAEA